MNRLWPSLRPTVIVAAIVAALAFAAWAIPEVFGAQDRDRPRTPGYPVYLSWVTCTPKLGPFGEPVKMLLGLEFSQVEIAASGQLEVKIVATIEHDLMDVRGGTVLVGDTVYDDREIAAALEAVALREYRTAFPSALPTRKKGLRSK